MHRRTTSFAAVVMQPLVRLGRAFTRPPLLRELLRLRSCNLSWAGAGPDTVERVA